MKKTALTLIPILAFFCRADALTYICGQTSDPENVVWSTCVWTNNEHMDDPATLPGRPGKNDSVIVRAGHVLKCDMDITIRDIKTGTNGRFTAEGKKIFIKNGVTIREGTGDVQSYFEFKNCKVETGPWKVIPVISDQRGMGMAAFRMTDSEVSASGGIMSTISTSFTDNRGNKGGFEIFMEGKTKFTMNGDTVLDPLYSDAKGQYSARLIFKEKNGNVPFMQIKKINTEVFEVAVSVYSELKKGRYPLLEILDNKDTVESLKKITFKGRAYELGAEFDLGERKAKIVADAASKGGPKNDLVLVVD